MTHRGLAATLALAAATLVPASAAAQGGQPKLHVNTRWKECSIQLDPALTQSAWRQFTQEAGLVAYFRPLADARPSGRGHFELSVLQWQTGIDDNDAAWNDTFVHPDSTHWLFEGSGLAFPGLTARAGVTATTDVGIYFTKNFRANYGFWGAQLQQSLVRDPAGDWAAAARVSFVSLFGPEDVGLGVYGVDLLASRRWSLSRWAAVSPYAGVSSYLSTSHEKSPRVNLDDERVAGAQAMLGAAFELSAVRLGVEYNLARVSSLSLKAGVGR
ncbi:MAG TPA: hypothetical protein VHM30_04305 [Gemmatimonadaceae bacterium]|nr:hypothetical protein [Gemmatimonadaceae bacterium]